jgi:hypothetical protein
VQIFTTENTETTEFAFQTTNDNDQYCTAEIAESAEILLAIEKQQSLIIVPLTLSLSPVIGGEGKAKRERGEYREKFCGTAVFAAISFTAFRHALCALRLFHSAT